MSLDEYMPIDLEALREATHRLTMADWLGERARIESGYVKQVLFVIEFADMHKAVVGALINALRLASTEEPAKAELLQLREAIALAERALAAPLVPPCRCGWREGEGEHPCHAKQCHRPGARRLYPPMPPQDLSSPGMRETWACNECWARFRARTSEAAS